MKEANIIREKIEELTEDMQAAFNRKDFELCDELDIEISDLMIKLNLLLRPDLYYIEK